MATHLLIFCFQTILKSLKGQNIRKTRLDSPVHKHLYYILYHIILFQEINSQILLNNKYNNKVNIQINIIKQNILDFDIKNIFIYKANIIQDLIDIKDKLGQNVDKYTRIFAKIYTKNLKTLNKNSNKYKEIEQKRQNIIYNLDYLDKIYVIWDKLAERHEKAKALNNLCVSKFYVNSLLSNKLNNKKTTKLVAKKENKKNTNNALIKEVNYGLLENTNNSIAPSKGNNKANFLNKIILQTNDITKIIPYEKIIKIKNYIIQSTLFPVEVFKILDNTKFKNIFNNLTVIINGRLSGLYIETNINGNPFSHMSFHFVNNTSNSPIHLKGNNVRIPGKNINISQFSDKAIDCYLQQTLFGIKIITQNYNPLPLEAFIIDISIISLNILMKNIN